jgi:hypothetical protein
MEPVTMNHFGAQALQHWQTYRPTELATIEDPTRYFTDLGNQIEQEIDHRATQAEHREKVHEINDDLTRMGRLGAIRQAATEAVMREMVFLDEEPS